MSDRRADSSPGEAVRDVVRGRSVDEIDAAGLLSHIKSLLDSRASIDEIMPLIEQLRRSGEQEQISRLDMHFLERHFCVAGARKQLERVIKELRGKLAQLLAPPFFPARYVGSVETPDGVYAHVAHDGAYRVVAFGDELKPEDVDAGDEVYLCHERNVAIGRAPKNLERTGEIAALARRIDDGRIVLGDREAQVMVNASRELADQPLKPGDAILWDRGARMALSRIEHDDGLHSYRDVGDTPPPRLGGLDKICESVLSRFVFGILYPDVARQYQVLGDSSRRLLLMGPPGTGKTSMMLNVASSIADATGRPCRVVTIAGAELYSSYVGETERNIRGCFATLEDYDGPGIAFFDEIDAIGRVRGQPSGFHDDRFLGTLLAELEGMRRSDVAVIAATNRADALDPALRSRFSWEIEMPRPNTTAARQIFELHMDEQVPYRPNGAEAPSTRQAIIESGVARLFEPNADNAIATVQFRDGKRREIAVRDLVSGRLIEQICTAARAAAFERLCRGGEPGVCLGDMQTAATDAIERLRNTLTPQNARSYLGDLPQDVDVVAVEAIRPRVDSSRYAR